MKMLSIAALAASLLSTAAVAADAPAAPAASTASARINVWPGVAPGSETWTQQEQDTKMPWGDRVTRNIAKPTLEFYAADPARASGAAMIVAPGGAFRFLSIDSEGTQVCSWLAAHGISAFLLRYRTAETAQSDVLFAGQIFAILAPMFAPGPALMDNMKQYGPPAIADGKQSLRLVRERAAEWKIDAKRVGFIGFSAGGAVATALSLDADASARPNVTAAIYPGPWPLDHVPADAPPLFIAAAADDSITKYGATPLAAAWTAAGRPLDIHLYEKGGHGFGMKTQNKPSDQWLADFAAWLTAQGMITPTAK
ncbi:MAG TPA: alpha/beta hydrolase [Nevskiaceae bacterium]|nr:alpha/beta hydrolase [Nevskiaceae bacterium]